MCGLVGFSAPGNEALSDLGRMLAAISHRGPDGTGTFLDETLALGHTRLAIIELTGGAQPRVDTRTGDALSFNGEIYGYRALASMLRGGGLELRDNSDTEVLFHLIRMYGVREAVERVNGMFAFAFRDGSNGDLFLVRDRFGEKPLYFGIAHGQLVFASEPKAILCHSAFRHCKPDLAAAYQLLQFEYLPGRASGWTGIQSLEPGSILSFRTGKATIERYWQPRLGSNKGVSEFQAAEQLDVLLREAVKNQLVADVPVGVFLSGGLDSSILTAIAAQTSSHVSAFTVRIEEHGYDESAYARMLASQLGVRHEIVPVLGSDLSDALSDIEARMSDFLADSSLLPTWVLCRAARGSVKVALGGDGADELFAGYPNFRVQRLARLMQWLSPDIGRVVRKLARSAHRGGYMGIPFLVSQLSQGFGQPIQRQSFHWMAPFDPDGLRSIWATEIPQVDLHNAAFAEIDAVSDQKKLCQTDRLLLQFLARYLSGDILVKTDRAAMFNGLEVRAPFLDRSFAEFACSLPEWLKLRLDTPKYILRQLGRRYLPPAVIKRSKHGFAVPIGPLIRSVFRERCEDVLRSVSNPISCWFARRSLERLINEHMTGERDHGKQLWALYMLFSVSAQQGRWQTEAARDSQVRQAYESGM